MPFKVNDRSWIDGLDRTARQMTKATSDALTATARDVSDALAAESKSVFDRPTKFTERGFGYTRSTRETQEATVFAKRIQSQYLIKQVTGGERRAGDYATSQRAGVVLPGPAGRTTGAGGVPRGSVRRLAERKDHWIGEYKGILGLWKRTKTKLRLVNAFKKSVTYEKRFDFFGVFERTAKRQLPERFKEAWDKLKP